ncbi:uncharacterized protein LOC120255115 [Dioscorea cayenensis subsp. rotundata]|uniref:Uncharacterized protein LOC120255115 n=1 Tax=Dioscorea cayennensis subsp. rotundata TaxID=55577 RepID=A0AB40AVC6_DIOCR|nr:uncharacterized protein LOC120255115 [Dioscorea cayenensis subsp. rotundata]
MPLPLSSLPRGAMSNSSRNFEPDMFTVGQCYESATQFKEAFCDHAIKRNFNIQFIKYDKERVTVTCATNGCEWCVHASRDGNLPTFRIKTTQGVHTCSGGISTTSHPKASKKWVGRHVIPKLRDRPLYCVVDIQRDLLLEQGVHLPYKQAWMGKELARGILHGSDISSYDMLLWYAGKLAETNPGSIVIIDKDGEQFRCGFFCFGACLNGFRKGCRPMLFLNGTHLLGRYSGILLGATSKDANEGLFHLPFAIMDNETDNNWTWFISTLGDALYGEADYGKIITLISDRSKGLMNAMARVFLSSPHVYCLRHLQENFLKSNS